MRQTGARHADMAEKTGFHLAGKLALFRILDGAADSGACVVDEQIDSAFTPDDLGDGGVNGGRVSKVEPQHGNGAAVRNGGPTGGTVDAHTETGKRLGDGAANARRRARDETDAALFQTHGRQTSLLFVPIENRQE